jgi:hypothetical protein
MLERFTSDKHPILLGPFEPYKKKRFWAKGAQQSVTKFITTIFMNLVTPKAATELDLLYNKLAPGRYMSGFISVSYLNILCSIDWSPLGQIQ